MLKTNLRHAIDPRHAKTFDTTQLREEFLIDKLWIKDDISLTYTQYDRMIVGGATPKIGPLTIDGVDKTGTTSWLGR